MKRPNYSNMVGAAFGIETKTRKEKTNVRLSEWFLTSELMEPFGAISRYILKYNTMRFWDSFGPCLQAEFFLFFQNNCFKR